MPMTYQAKPRLATACHCGQHCTLPHLALPMRPTALYSSAGASLCATLPARCETGLYLANTSRRCAMPVQDVTASRHCHAKLRQTSPNFAKLRHCHATPNLAASRQRIASRCCALPCALLCSAPAQPCCGLLRRQGVGETTVVAIVAPLSQPVILPVVQPFP